jgi:glycerol-3-phosphate dehydrogenase (NAD(P)+)
VRKLAMRDPIAVLGAGSWGSALAVLLASNGFPTRLWGHDPKHIGRLELDRENVRHLPGIRFPRTLQPQGDLASALRDCSDLLIAVPSHAFRELLQRLRPHVTRAVRLCWATKGLEPHSGKLLHEVVREELGRGVNAAVVSGPSFAREVAARKPTAVTVASQRPALAEHFASCLHNRVFRPYTSRDMVGVELGGALKNILAIAAGIADGLAFGANSRAALITRGLAEMARLGTAMGGRRDTFTGLAGLGDLVLTCTDDQSRNRRMGLFLAQGLSVQEARTRIGQAVEGVETARVAVTLAAARGVDMPITAQTYRVLFEDLPPSEAVHALLTREPKAECA